MNKENKESCVQKSKLRLKEVERKVQSTRYLILKPGLSPLRV
jgi:hypothetical protein